MGLLYLGLVTFLSFSASSSRDIEGECNMLNLTLEIGIGKSENNLQFCWYASGGLQAVNYNKQHMMSPKHTPRNATHNTMFACMPACTENPAYTRYCAPDYKESPTRARENPTYNKESPIDTKENLS